MASSSTPSSSTTTVTKNYEVFLSFRGKDTREGFTSHLYDALCQKNIKTFRDDDELRRGVEISPALLRAIEESKIAVVIFSKKYATSEWCLSELAEIIKRMQLKELIVMPVFYHVDPSDVQELKGRYKCSFANEAVQKWREALTEASNQAGFDFDSSKTRNEAELVREIVKAVWRELRSKYIPSPSDFEGLVGIHERIEQVKALLCLGIEDVRIIGIWGMGGVGKTTIAGAVFKSISYEFDGACIIDKVGKILEDGGSEQLKRDVLSKVLHEENPKLNTPVRPDIMGMLKQKKVFIVLDDVDTIQMHKISTLKTFVETLINQCGLGSRIIITSRDKDKLCTDDRMIHKVEGFNFDEALELFHKHANPTEDCKVLSRKIVNYANGNPLALTVSGSSLKGKNKQEWESALNDLPEMVNSRIINLLKISYEGLDKKEKKLFLDLACFGDAYDFFGLLKEEFIDGLKFSLSGLVAKSLITRHIREGYIEMHDLLQEMGTEIVCSESPNNPGKRSRLWEQNDVIQTLEKNTGTDAVEVIFLDMDFQKDIHLSSQVFDKMHNLRFLMFGSMFGFDKVLHLPNGLNCLPDELMFLHWPGYPLRALPLNFKPEKLIKLDLSGSNIEQLWEGTKPAPKLKWLILRNCPHLTRIPNLSNFPLLVEVDLGYCKSLVDLTSSVQPLKNLRDLDLSDCKRLTRIPSLAYFPSLEKLNLSSCTSLVDLTSSVQPLKNLRDLDLRGCKRLTRIPSLAYFPSLEELNLSSCTGLFDLTSSVQPLKNLRDLDLSDCKSLKLLDVSGSTAGQLPSSIRCLENLEYLDCSGCWGLTILPPLSGLHSLQTLKCSRCSLMEIPDDIGCLSSLKELELCGNRFESLPKSIKQLSKLEFLSLEYCTKLRSLPDLPEGLKCLDAKNCDQLCLVPDASEFVRCINSKSHDSTYIHRVNFIFCNCSNLIKAVSNCFEESVRIMQRTEKGSGKPPNEFSIYLPGNKIPEWFSYKSRESSVNFSVLRNDLVNRKFMGFAICVVLGFEEYCERQQLQYIAGVDYDIDIITNYDHIQICNVLWSYYKQYRTNYNIVHIDSDHMLLGNCSFYSGNLKKLLAGDSEYVDISIKFKIRESRGQLKRCAVHPIYAEEPIEKIGATIQEIGETSGRRSDRSNDSDEEVEPHPKRICTQAINTP